MVGESTKVKIPSADLLEKLVRKTLLFSDASVLISNDFPGSDEQFLGAFGVDHRTAPIENSFEQLKAVIYAKPDWYFGHFSYELGNENNSSEKTGHINFPLLHFFKPEFLVRIENENVLINGKENQDDFFESGEIPVAKKTSQINITQRTSHAEYIAAAEQLIKHIHRGDIYEVNYCIEFFAENVVIDPPSLFLTLNEKTEAPFSALYKNGDKWLMCASPERFIRKKGEKIISQPIKGTKPRGKNAEEDERLKKELFNDEKERSENVMIVDLVRNDLSRSAKKGSVKVEELFGIHTFKSVHQMISTVSAELDPEINIVDAIRNAFPMGSMTGAPKIRAMELIEKYEHMKRGLYSGAVGYFTPEMDFDFNVVIRSIQYNAATGYLSFMVGSALTANADPEKEYAECLLKAKALFESLGVSGLEF